ncbi:hypothetical protein EIN_405230 [Entamoeba invadens IP1]|uniref:Uncharacterized protein n=1 Tax=Entamoeba invadens IP1 TaxID=370355 RepID=A0A0A1UCT8_ENTIV|nr:hypothetical protein EIN_405230 [Entamoeba invadens IP1]ELP90109.1 hypothetical protein EIN_405230 [Entamoeba invadens IP1]|eukprot:XP_004256880.1 hypothetical protein EIN_405230 [Entamoeba invadens IP1]
MEDQKNKENKDRATKPTKNDDKNEVERRQWKTKYDDSTIRIRLEKSLYDKLITIKEVNTNQRLSLNKIINQLYDSFIARNPQYAPSKSDLSEEDKQIKSDFDEKKE